MTEEYKINIALAELYGWTNIHKLSGHLSILCYTY
jgi:hypothetical protein